MPRQHSGDPSIQENDMFRRQLLAPLMLALAAGSALAQDVRLYRPGEAVDPQDVAAILAAPQAPAPGMKMRSLRLLDDAPSAQATPTAERRASALALPVQFAFDSADILPSARQQLDALAEGIRLLPEIQSVVIEGHTDAAGPDTYNEQLSQRRASAVKRYLITTHQIDPKRLRPVGVGESAPLSGRDPLASANRRVQFRSE
jgi:outer membrane protein OmpA-like peptidoglycan-associated protein